MFGALISRKLKVRFVNSTEFNFNLETSSTLIEESNSQWTESSCQVPGDSRGVIGELLQPMGPSIKEEESFIVITFLPPDQLAKRSHSSTDTADASLTLKVRVCVEAGRRVVSFAVNTVPESAVYPPTLWSSDTLKHVIYWWLPGGALTLKIKKKASSLSIVIAAVNSETSPESQPILNLLESLSLDSSLSYSEVYENQRRRNLFSRKNFTKQGLCLCERYGWTDEHGQRLVKPELVLLPSPNWTWIGEWETVISIPLTDVEGWRYANGWKGPWTNKCTFSKFVRRRRWVRIRKLNPEKSSEDKLRSMIAAEIRDTVTFDESEAKYNWNTDASKMAQVRRTGSVELLSETVDAIDSGFRFLLLNEKFIEMSKDQLSESQVEGCYKRLATFSPRYNRLISQDITLRSDVNS